MKLLGVVAAIALFSGNTMAEGRLVIGFYAPGIRMAPLSDIKITLQLWADEMARPHHIKAEAKTFSEMATLRAETIKGRIDLVIAPAMELAETYWPGELTNGFIPVRKNRVDGMALLVRSDAAVKSLADLRKKTILRQADDRLALILLETFCHQQIRQHCDSAVNIAEEKRDSLSIHKLFFGRADAALVSLEAWLAALELNPQLESRLRVLSSWSTASHNFALIPANADPAMKKLILEYADKATSTPRGRQILELFGAEAIQHISSKSLQPYWSLAREYHAMPGHDRHAGASP
jgi:ABC-type nitrate/sulfonate/bicarbonate transport system substrate-binding protein